MNRSTRSKKRLAYQATFLGLAMFLLGSQALAQSAGSFLTSPYVPPAPPPSAPTIEANKMVAEPKCVCPDPKSVAVTDKTEKPIAKKPEVSQGKAGKPAVVTTRPAKPQSTRPTAPVQKKVESDGSGAPKKPKAGTASSVGLSPVVMFRPSPNVMPMQTDGAIGTEVALAPIASILPNPIAPLAIQMDALPHTKSGRGGFMQNHQNVMKPVTFNKKIVKSNPNPSAFARIWRDSKTGLLHDAPEALADALPWVDKGQKAEPLSEVLTKVVDDLSRAAAQDPEWVNPAGRELRELSKRLATLSEPPPAVQSSGQDGSSGGMSKEDRPISYGSRPFRPRPIWPGATPSAEVQSRPVSVVTYTGLDNGPAVQGQPLPLADDPAEQSAANPKPQSKKAPSKRPGRRSK
jgi:hypothetical protein